MGLEAKEFSTDQELDWPRGEALLQHSGTGELPKPSFKRRQPPTEQQSEPPLNCPRCSSTNTKFCYYNNYNKSQPRYFCKSCKRHWTKGGTLRNVPVGGGRKHKRLRISNAAAAAANTAAPAGVSGKDETIMSNILIYKALGSINGANPSTEYSFSSTFDVNSTCVINNPTCSSYNQSSYEHLDKNYPSNLDSMDESTITTLDIPNGSWPDPGSNLDLPNYWNWNEIDFLSTTSHDLNISWDDLDADQF